MKKQHTGSFMTTFTGVKFYPNDPRKEDFNLEDIAHALSHENRANGHTTVPFSVAQHCVMVSEILQQLGYNTRTQLIGLMHDGSEGYIKDLPSPLKELLPEYRTIEGKVQNLIYEWAGLGEVTEEDYAPVHWVDKAMYPIEARDFMPQTSIPVDPRLEDVVIIPWEPKKARVEFIKRFHELQLKNYTGKVS
ncbi:hypothetical protein [Brevibacillus laterosporus]|uniref:hypothetical protein n=1 Tax=Brevibacillus laterosporus TaxID=1465 RepID=UPI003D1BFBA3